jgi:Tol biopolymer transport system component
MMTLNNKKVQIFVGAMVLFFVQQSVLLCEEIKKINPGIGQSTWLICKKMGILTDETTSQALYNASQIGGVITLGTSGNYFAAENLNYPIAITANSVYLNLNGYTVTESDPARDVVTVAADTSDIIISNGYLMNSSGTAVRGSGVFADEGVSLLQLNDLGIFNCAKGVYLHGIVANEVNGCSLTGLDLTENVTAVYCEHANENTVRECCARGSLNTAFFLSHCVGNGLYDCQALKTTSTVTAAGFYSENGSGNLFQGCVAKKTESTAEVFGYKSYGFVLTMTEEKTKIIDCIVNETTLSETGSAAPYGIRLVPSFQTGNQLLATVTATSVGNAIISVSWAPDAQHLAYCDDQRNLYVSLFDGTDIFSIATTTLATATVRYLDWSPDGIYLATGDGDGYVRVFEFSDPTLTQIAALQLTNFHTMLGVAWSPDGNFIACGDDFSSVHVFSFDGVTLVHEAENETPGDEVNRVTWSPDSQFIAAGSAFSSGVNSVNVFGVVGAAGALQLNHIDGDNIAVGAVNSIAWALNGRYIICGDSAGDVVVYNFDGLVVTMVNINGSAISSLVRGVAWSPDGDYAVNCDDQGYLRVWSFDLTSTTSFVTSDGAYTDLSWSPDGQYIATSEQNTPLTNGAVRIYNIMAVPRNCLVDNCRVCDTIGQNLLLGLGISGSTRSFFLRNIAANNDINYSPNIRNVFDNENASERIAEPFDNLSIQKFPS